jgi:lysophospholipid acyltransferase (LPLAT)-like uncharacterized protein
MHISSDNDGILSAIILKYFSTESLRGSTLRDKQCAMLFPVDSSMFCLTVQSALGYLSAQ